MRPSLLPLVLLLAAADTLAAEYPNDLVSVPPMGWNSWNAYGSTISAELLLTQAQAMVDSGLRDAGWVYLVVDDGWQGDRGGDYDAIQGNEKFPDVGATFAAVRALGLRPGIYSTPWEHSYQGLTGGFEHEIEDAWQWAAWDVRYLKYDWNPVDVASATRMRDALAGTGSDIVYSLSNSLNHDLTPTWAEVSNLWRTTRDITDTWDSMAGIGFAQDGLEAYAGPGSWNDPDMLVLGVVGWGVNQRPTRLTPDEQRTHVTLWALLAAPLMLGCDLTQLDEATLALLTNDRVLEVGQDPAGIQGSRAFVAMDGSYELWTRPLASGDLALGIFERGGRDQTVTVEWWQLGIAGSQPVHDLWDDQPLGDQESVTVEVPAHGVRLLRIGAHTPLAPALVGPLRERGTVGAPFGYTLLGTGERPFTIEATGLPPGLALDGNTILGTPTEAGTWEVALEVGNAGGTTTETLTLTMAAPPDDGDVALLWLAASDPSSPPAQATTLSWRTTGATAATLEPGLGAVDPSGSVQVDPTETTTYTLSVEGQGGPLQRAITVTVPESVLLGLASPGRLRPTNDPSEWQGWEEAREDYSIGRRALWAGGRHWLHGLGTHADSRLVYDLDGRYRTLEAWVAVDDEVDEPSASVELAVWLDEDDTPAWTSGALYAADPPLALLLDISGAHTLTLTVTDGGDGIDNDHADWLEPRLWVAAAQPPEDSAAPDDSEPPADSEPPCSTDSDTPCEACPADEGCGGCSHGGGPGGGWWLLVAVLGGWRRRDRQAPAR